MIIVLSPERHVTGEALLTNQLFANGLDYFHIRKYRLSDKEISDYISGIDQQYYHKLVLHSHYHLADHFGINRLHFREESRQKKEHIHYQDNHILSTSTHSIEDF
ncbi:thiamine phosphate synthase, partial [Elizabethkingia meningoseptica]|nr:thiamine phosphate synthase [Elizabethkingia meningoseptica]